MNYFGMTDIGTTRDNNEDRFGIFKIGDNALLAVVCDGMGGLMCGEVASRLALDAFAKTVLSICHLHLKDGKLSLDYREAELIFENAVSHANDCVMTYELSHPECKGMGTTLVAALLCGGNVIAWVNIGDSRFYTVDSRDILQVSRDHSYYQYLLDTGEMTPEEAAKAAPKNLITRAIGISDVAEPDLDIFELTEVEAAGTSLMLCTDGLSGSICEEECMRVINDNTVSLEEKGKYLIDTAKQNGSTDNITLVLITV